MTDVTTAGPADWTPDIPVEPLDAPGHILDLLEPLRGPDIAVVDADGALTYDGLGERSAAIAAALRAAGTRPGDPVVVHTRLSRWAIAAMLGVLRAGARYVPIDAAFPLERQRYMATASGARLAVTEPGLPVTLDRLQTIPADTAGAIESSAQSPQAVHCPLAYTCFTSGSTGAPKGVTVSAAALTASTAARLAYYPEPVTAFLLCSSISFDSSVSGIYWTLACHGRIVIPSDRPADLAAIGRAARHHRASHLLMLPSLYSIALGGGAERFATALVDQAEFLGPYAFFGHSMGAPLAYETALALRERSRTGPRQLFMSVNAPPHLHRPGLSLSELTEPGFAARVEKRYGPLPPGLADDPGLRERYLATLYADLTAVAAYRPAPQAPLDCPVLALGGAQDWESEDRLAEWRRHTTGPCEVRILPGGHFYFRDRPDAFFDALSDRLTRLAHGLPDTRLTNP
ncbi:AMP-binding protein [Streptomyces sp. NPDC002920]